MGVSGDFGELDKLLERLASPDRMLRAIGQDVKKEVVDLYQTSFAGQRGPFGQSWGPTPNRLIKSTALANPSISYSSGAIKVRSIWYWVFHQAGTKSMREHELLPFGHGSSWDGPIERTMDVAVKKHFGKV